MSVEETVEFSGRCFQEGGPEITYEVILNNRHFLSLDAPTKKKIFYATVNLLSFIDENHTYFVGMKML